MHKLLIDGWISREWVKCLFKMKPQCRSGNTYLTPRRACSIVHFSISFLKVSLSPKPGHLKASRLEYFWQAFYRGWVSNERDHLGMCSFDTCSAKSDWHSLNLRNGMITRAELLPSMHPPPLHSVCAPVAMSPVMSESAVRDGRV
jgi:hypothetical protein